MLRRQLIQILARLGPWRDQDTRRALFADLAWGLSVADPHLPQGCSPKEAAESLVDLALASQGVGGVRRCGALALGLPGLLEDLRELGGGGDLDALVARCGLTPSRCWSENPYPGLRPLEHWQSPIFFGRRAEIRGLLRRLVDPATPWLQVITGQRGCGKSSLMGAGVRGWLAAGGLPRIPDADRWVVSALFPAGYGGDPFLALAHGLARALDATQGAGSLDAPLEAAALKSGGAEALAALCERVLAGRPREVCWVLALDQLEELFTLVDPDLADDFLEMLVAPPHEPRLRLLAALRADHLHHCCSTPALIQVLNRGGLFVLGPPSRASLERMILGPLTTLEPNAQVTADAELVARLLADAEAAPDGLSFIGDSLRELYARGASAGRLTLGLYRDLGLTADCSGLARRAERALDLAGDGKGSALGRLFPQLVEVRPDGTATRRRADHHRIAAQPEIHRLVEVLADPEIGLVRIRRGDRPTVELVQEALLRQWPVLRHWIERHCEALRLRSQVERDTRVWLDHGRSPVLRWNHGVLESARALLTEGGFLQDLERDPDVADFLALEPDWLLAELLCAAVTPFRREEVGLRLSEIGDPRDGVGVANDGTPCIQWCALPGGEVSVEGHGIFQVPPLRIAAFPVTQAQFQAFTEARDGFTRTDWWRGLRRPPSSRGLAARRGNYPATQVSWFEAVAFSRWASARLGLAVRLPEESEWQWAAQSARPGFVYPWGRDWREGHANTEEGALGRLTAVGLYPAGRSLQGVYDLAGNAWEWCRGAYERPRDRSPAPESPRVLKGGSWRVNRGFARADFRLEGLPEDRMAGSGFRLVTDD